MTYFNIKYVLTVFFQNIFRPNINPISIATPTKLMEVCRATLYLNCWEENMVSLELS